MNPFSTLKRTGTIINRAVISSRTRTIAQARSVRNTRRTFFSTSRLAWKNDKEEDKGKEETNEETGVEEDEHEAIKELKEKNEELEKLVEELRHGWKSALAEQDNIRKRASKEVEKAREFGVEKLCKQLFTTCDTMNIILQHKPDFELEENKDNTHAKSAFEGLEQVKSQFLAAFSEGYDIEEFTPAIGDQFDPLLHNALFEVDPPKGKNVKPGRVGLLVKSGWKRKNQLLRPASVGVVRQEFGPIEEFDEE